MASMATNRIITNSAEETFELAYAIGESIIEPAVFLLQGDLGAGKTVFAKGIAAGLEIDPDEVNSPTYTLVNQYSGRLRMYHLDLYRIECGVDEIRELGLEEMLSEDSVLVIEWAERLGTFIFPNASGVTISDLGGDKRQIEISQAIPGSIE